MVKFWDLNCAFERLGWNFSRDHSFFSTIATFFDIRDFYDWESTFWSFSRNFFKKTRSSFFKVSVRLFLFLLSPRALFYFLRSIFQFRPYKNQPLISLFKIKEKDRTPKKSQYHHKHFLIRDQLLTLYQKHSHLHFLLKYYL